MAAGLFRVDGISDFEDLHSRQQNGEVQFYAFDRLATDRTLRSSSTGLK
jgi:hypothetical protein